MLCAYRTVSKQHLYFTPAFWMPFETFSAIFTYIEYVPADLESFKKTGDRDAAGIGGHFDFRRQEATGDAISPVLFGGGISNTISWNLPGNMDSSSAAKSPWVGIFEVGAAHTELLQDEWYYGHTDKRAGGLRWPSRYFPSAVGTYEMAIVQAEVELARIRFTVV